MSTDVWDEVASIEDKIPRDRWQRPLIKPAAGGKPVAYTRVTTFAGSIEDMFGLGQWQQRMVALGLATRPDLVLSVAAHADDKNELNRIVDSAREAAAASAAATTGTALHRLAERYDRGQITLAEVPESNRADLAAYAAAMAPLRIHGIEQFVVVDEIQVAGTFDRIVEYGGQRYVADIKTGSIEYGSGKMAVQLALYAHGWLYEPKRNSRGSTGVSTTAGIIIHLPAGTGRCDLYWIDLRAGWEAAELCDKVRAWRKRKGLLAAATFGAAEPIPSPTLSRLEVAMLAKVGCPDCAVGRPDDPADAHPAADCPNPYLLCQTCDAGGHTCPGCGGSVPHGTNACDTCTALTVVGETFDTAELTLSQQIAEAADAAALEALWAAHRDEWTAEHTRLATARKTHLHQRVLKDAVAAATA